MPRLTPARAQQVNKRWLLLWLPSNQQLVEYCQDMTNAFDKVRFRLMKVYYFYFRISTYWLQKNTTLSNYQTLIKLTISKKVVVVCCHILAFKLFWL
jgi:hypothetical protein